MLFIRSQHFFTILSLQLQRYANDGHHSYPRNSKYISHKTPVGKEPRPILLAVFFFIIKNVGTGSRTQVFTATT